MISGGDISLDRYRRAFMKNKKENNPVLYPNAICGKP